MPIVVHHLDDSRSQRILWLLEELGVEYTIQHHKRGADRRAPQSLRDVHPLGKAPVITDGARTVAESGAIVEYLIATYGDGRGVPTSPDARLDDSFWSHFAEGSLMPTLVLKLLFGTLLPTQSPFFVRPLVKMICGSVIGGFIDPDLKSKISFAGAELDKKGGGAAWFAGGDKDGNPTAADYQMLFPLETGVMGGRSPVTPPALVEYVKRCQERPAYQRALEKGGPYAYGPSSSKL